MYIYTVYTYTHIFNMFADLRCTTLGFWQGIKKRDGSGLLSWRPAFSRPQELFFYNMDVGQNGRPRGPQMLV